VIRSLCVYCGSSPGADPAFTEAARDLGRACVERDIRVIYGGAHVGLMGTLADTVLEHRGTVIGVMPQGLIDREIGHTGLTEQHIVGSMHERKALMAELADSFVALPGGVGTLEELIETYTWRQLGIHAKPLGVLNIAGYYDALLTFLDDAVDRRFLRADQRAALVVESEPVALLETLSHAVAPPNVFESR
jgi:uncharacterized protein (TIGR00730 family)